jgi:hypothetical protein
MATYRVTAPYVLLKTKDNASGESVVAGFYAGAVVSDEQVDKDSIKRHLAKKMVERVAAQSASNEFDPAADRSPEDLQKLKVEQLKAYAEKREVDLGGATKKDEILAALAAAAEGSGQGDGESGGDQGTPGSPDES